MTTTHSRGVVVLARARAGERDVDQQRDRDDQRERGDELDDRERRAVEAGEPQERAGEHAQLGPEEGLEAADRAADQAAEGGLAPRRGVVVREAGTAGVVVGDEHDRAWPAAESAHDTTFCEARRPNSRRIVGTSKPASRKVSSAAASASGGAGDGDVDRQDAGHHGGRGEDRVGERPARVDRRATRSRRRDRAQRAAARRCAAVRRSASLPGARRPRSTIASSSASGSSPSLPRAHDRLGSMASAVRVSAR